MSGDAPPPSGWLPPQAPGGQAPPRFDAPPAPPVSEPPAPPPYAPPDHAAGSPARSGPHPTGPTFTTRGRAGGGRRRSDPLAIWSIVLGIAGLLLLLFSLGLGFLFALPCSIAGWVCASASRKRHAAGQGGGGKGMADAGRIVGILGVGLAVVAMVVWVALIAGGVSIDDFQRGLERKLQQQRESSAQRAWLGDRPLG